jgi:hypothetical protein
MKLAILEKIVLIAAALVTTAGIMLLVSFLNG